MVGVTARAACGEPQMGVPMLVRLPLYDAERGQQFPFRTLCMLLSLGSLLGVSKLAKCAFHSGLLPDILRSFRTDPETALESPATSVKTAANKSASSSAVGKSPENRLEERDGNTGKPAESMIASTPKKLPKRSLSTLTAGERSAPEEIPAEATSVHPLPASSARRDKSALLRKRLSEAEWKTSGSVSRVMPTSSSALTARNASAKRRGTAVPVDYGFSEHFGKLPRKGSRSKDTGSKDSGGSSKMMRADGTEDGKGERDAARKESMKVAGQMGKPT
ncbi:hypothetical protein HPB48_012606 [Haemaphysalis longicornis]|uniref:Uncharacterized protein n=1 Tax=Haemaphysalis longicornis TaxID=44386 RepID=A0A9J6G1V6_HAELO|nr:hypothetical protein HPB48_012606 [Haemaphysalis longicornis]